MKQATPKFSPDTITFLKKASRQKKADWLDQPKNRADYERVLLAPLQRLARTLKTELQPLARDYNFPQKGIGRIRRSADKAREYGSYYKDWLSYSAGLPRTSRFDHNPNIFFLIQAEDKDDPFLLAGGLYMPSSRQLRALREAFAQPGSSVATAFDRLFASKDFARVFPGGFCREKMATRPPRGYDAAHPRIDWLKLQGFFVWRGYTRREWSSPGFAELVARDARQILRLNELLEQVLGLRPAPVTTSRPGRAARRLPEASTSLLDRLADLERVERPREDF